MTDQQIKERAAKNKAKAEQIIRDTQDIGDAYERGVPEFGPTCDETKDNSENFIRTLNIMLTAYKKSGKTF